MPCRRGVMKTRQRRRSRPMGSAAFEWWNRIATSVVICHADSDSGRAERRHREVAEVPPTRALGPPPERTLPLEPEEAHERAETERDVQPPGNRPPEYARATHVRPLDGYWLFRSRNAASGATTLLF